MPPVPQAWSASLPHDANAIALAPDGTFAVAGATVSMPTTVVPPSALGVIFASAAPPEANG